VLHFHTLLGVEKGSTLPVLVPILFAGLAVLGAAWGLYLKWGRPDVYAGIGHGAKAALVTAEAEPVGVAGGR
jgi:hypothetical protein